MVDKRREAEYRIIKQLQQQLHQERENNNILEKEANKKKNDIQKM